MTETVDVTGLLPYQVKMIHDMVKGYREQNATLPSGPPPNETAEEWVARFTAWAESHPKRDGITLDDSRESIYE